MDLTDIVRPIVADKKIVLATEALAGATTMVATLEDLGAEAVAVISETDGVGELPEAITSIRVPSRPAASMMEGIRQFRTSVETLPAEALDTWDPTRDALFLCGPFDPDRPVAGRRSFGGRPEPFERLEDKTTVDQLWSEAEIPHAPFRVVPASAGALLEAAHALDHGSGTVWVADNTLGWHGGGDYLRWVRTTDHLNAAIEFMHANATHVRVMPFLEGIPCSIHGVVSPDRVLAFRPVEMVMLRRPEQASMQYAGLATLWDPLPADREFMREVARRVGGALRNRVGYRGAFGIDGVMTREGFRPTELNTRLSGGLGIQARSVDGLHLGLVNRMLLAGETPDIDWARLESSVVTAADAQRSSRCIIPLPVEPPAWTRLDLAAGPDGFSSIDDPEGADATLGAGDHPMGTVLLLEAIEGRIPPGRPFGPLVVSALDEARAHGVDIPHLVAATDVRSQG